MDANDINTELLLVEDDAAHAQTVVARLRETGRFNVTRLERLSPAIKLAATGHIDAVLLDLSLPDSRGLDTLVRMRAAAPDLPVVVIGDVDEELCTAAVRAGAQDCLDRGRLPGCDLGRVVRHAIERQRALSALREQSLVDELTGLYNRRGFVQLAERQAQLAARNGNGFLVVFLDVDGLKAVNDSRGHAEGDALLRGAAEILRHSFRRSDVIARIGGDEFAVVTDEPLADAEAAAQVLRRRLRDRACELGRVHIVMSLGVAMHDAQAPRPIDELLALADRRMYEDRRQRREPTPARGPLAAPPLVRRQPHRTA